MISMLLMATALASHPGASYPGADLPDGSILYLTNSNKAVQLATDSPITHVALLMSDGNRRWVYEATPAKVRRLSLEDYHHELSRLNAKRKTAMRLYAVRPSREYAPKQLDRMRRYLQQQLGRRYSVKGYVRDRQADGIHCAELVSSAIGKSGRTDFDRNYAITPSEVVEWTADIYAPPRRVSIKSPPRKKKQSWCEASWSDCKSWSSWCGWSLRESWSWCW